MYNFTNRSQMGGRFICFLLLILALSSTQVYAKNNGWKTALVVPGSQLLVNADANFNECLTVETYFQKDWYRCKDTKFTSKMTWNSVWAKVHKDYDFVISKPGGLYVVFETKVAKNIWYYGDPTVGISYLDKDHKWENGWLGGMVRSAAYHGGKIHNGIGNKNGPTPLQYRINGDGTLKFNPGTTPVHYKPGTYRLTVVSATRFNSNTAEKTYVPSKGNAKVYFIPDGTVINGSLDKPMPGILYYSIKECQ